MFILLRCLRSFAHEPGEEFREVRSTRHHLQLGPVPRGYWEGIHDEEIADPHFAQPLLSVGNKNTMGCGDSDLGPCSRLQEDLRRLGDRAPGRYEVIGE